MEVIQKFLLTVLIVSFGLASRAQSYTIRGKVVDATTGEALIGVTVASKQVNNGGVLTDEDGNFKLSTKERLPLTLNASYIGYHSQDVDVYDNEETVYIKLNQNYNLTNEVVVVGYGTQKRGELTSAISSVNPDLLKQPQPSIEAALSGAVAGLNVAGTSGQPGSVSNIRIRGGNSITGGNEPLYVIDGFILYNDINATRTGATGSDAALDPLSFLNPADIESVEVLKDVAATAIYGTRGANGVIMITTKKGKAGRDNITYNSTFGWSTASKKLKFLNAQQWTDVYNEIRTYEGNTNLLINNPEDPIGTNWQDAALRTGFTQEYQLSIVGGDERSHFSISGGYKDQKGIVLGTDLKKYSGRFNYDHVLFGHLKVGITANGAFTQLNGLRNENGANNPNTYINAITQSPLFKIYNDDGTYVYEPNFMSETSIDGKISNPIRDLEDVKTLTENTRILTIGYAEYEVFKGFKLKANIGLDLSHTSQSNYAPSYTEPGLDLNGVASIGNRTLYTWQSEFTANYNTVVNHLHAIDILAGYTTQRTDRKGSSASSYDFANDETGYNNLASGAQLYWPTSERYTSTLKSVLGRINYSYNNRYNISATLRADGSSRFSDGHKWGYFPSVGISWNINNEPYIHLGKNISEFKLRLSTGVVGNQEIGDYQYVANIVPQTYYIGGETVTAYVIDNLSNNDLKWETTTSYNAGFNLGLFNDRLNFTFDVYYKKTSDLLLNVPVETVTGFSSALRNVGSVTNKGIEFEANYAIVNQKNLKWRVNVNIAHNINKVASLGSADYFLPSFQNVGLINYFSPLIVKVGEPLGSFYGYEFAGIVQSDEDISKLPAQSTETLAPGVVKYKDINGDGVVNEQDRTILGNSQPKLTGGLSTTINYKNWDLFLSLHMSIGNKLYNVIRSRFERPSVSYNMLASVLDRWTETNPSNTIGRATGSTSIVADDRYVEDASFLKFRNISLGYTIPFKQITPDSKLRLYLSLQNFFTITGYKGYDPEANRNGVDESNGLYQGIDFGTYPSAKTIQFGIQLTL